MPVDPPRDAAGCVVPHDHQEILDEQHVIRHITPNDLHTDQQTGVRRVASGAYSESSDLLGGMSVDIEEWMIADGLDPLRYLEEDSRGATRISVGALRMRGLKVGWDPQPHNPHHDGDWTAKARRPA